MSNYDKYFFKNNIRLKKPRKTGTLNNIIVIINFTIV